MVLICNFSFVFLQMKIVRGTRPKAHVANESETLGNMAVDHFPPRLLALMRSCWKAAPGDRPTAAELKSLISDPELLSVGSKSETPTAVPGASGQSGSNSKSTPAFTKEFTLYFIDGIPQCQSVLTLLSLCGILERTELRQQGFADVLENEELSEITPTGMLPALVIQGNDAAASVGETTVVCGMDMCIAYLDARFPDVVLPTILGGDIALRMLSLQMTADIKIWGFACLLDGVKETEESSGETFKTACTYSIWGHTLGDVTKPASFLRASKQEHALLVVEAVENLDRLVATQSKGDVSICGGSTPQLCDWVLYWSIKIQERTGRDYLAKAPALNTWFQNFKKAQDEVVTPLFPKTWTGQAPKNKTHFSGSNVMATFEEAHKAKEDSREASREGANAN